LTVYFLDVGHLRPIKDKLPSNIGFGKVKFVIAMLEIHYGLEGEEDLPPAQNFRVITPKQSPSVSLFRR